MMIASDQPLQRTLTVREELFPFLHMLFNTAPDRSHRRPYTVSSVSR